MLRPGATRVILYKQMLAQACNLSLLFREGDFLFNLSVSPLICFRACLKNRRIYSRIYSEIYKLIGLPVRLPKRISSCSYSRIYSEIYKLIGLPVRLPKRISSCSRNAFRLIGKDFPAKVSGTAFRPGNGGKAFSQRKCI